MTLLGAVVVVRRQSRRVVGHRGHRPLQKGQGAARRMLGRRWGGRRGFLRHGEFVLGMLGGIGVEGGRIRRLLCLRWRRLPRWCEGRQGLRP